MATFFVKGVGSSFYKNLDKIKMDDELEMVFGNKEYPEAIQLKKDNYIIGFIPKDTAKKINYFAEKYRKDYKCFVANLNKHEDKVVGFNVRVEVTNEAGNL